MTKSFLVQIQGLYFVNMMSSLCCPEEEEYNFPLQSQENANRVFLAYKTFSHIGKHMLMNEN